MTNTEQRVRERDEFRQIWQAGSWKKRHRGGPLGQHFNRSRLRVSQSGLRGLEERLRNGKPQQHRAVCGRGDGAPAGRSAGKGNEAGGLQPRRRGPETPSQGGSFKASEEEVS